MSHEETIKHAAVKAKNGWVIIGKCHADCFEKARNINLEMSFARDDQGFVTSRGNYVDRKIGAMVARHAEQVPPDCEILFSEDLWCERYKAKHTYDEINGYVPKPAPDGKDG